MIDLQENEKQSRIAAFETCDASGMKEDQIFVVGCSSGEVPGDQIGTAANLEEAEAIYNGIAPVLADREASLAGQCCEHLNRAPVMILTPLFLPLYDLSDETKRLILIIVAIHNLFSATVQPFAMPLSSGLRAAGDVRFTMWSSIFCTVLCRTLLSFLLAKWLRMGVIGIALAMTMDWCIKAILDIRRFRSGKWKNRRVI